VCLKTIAKMCVATCVHMYVLWCAGHHRQLEGCDITSVSSTKLTHTCIHTHCQLEGCDNSRVTYKMLTHTRIHTQKYTHTHTHAHTHTYTHIHPHPHPHPHAHTHTCHKCNFSSGVRVGAVVFTKKKIGVCLCVHTYHMYHISL